MDSAIVSVGRDDHAESLLLADKGAQHLIDMPKTRNSLEQHMLSAGLYTSRLHAKDGLIRRFAYMKKTVIMPLIEGFSGTYPPDMGLHQNLPNSYRREGCAEDSSLVQERCSRPCCGVLRRCQDLARETENASN